MKHRVMLAIRTCPGSAGGVMAVKSVVVEGVPERQAGAEAIRRTSGPGYPVVKYIKPIGGPHGR